jgi:hypothetical protein
VLLGLGLGCSGPKSDADSAAPAGPRVVLPFDGWTAAAGDGPFAADRPADAACPSAAYRAEAGFFEVESDRCAYAVFSQPLAGALQAGDRLDFVAWHLDLWAQVPAEARVVLQIEDEVIWEARFAVPGSEAIDTLEEPVAADHPAGATAWWHISNHGFNSWRLGDVERAARR